MNVILAIAGGGALGALGRHYFGLAALKLFGASFPYGTLGVNILGSFLMGIIIVALSHSLEISNEVKAFLTVGFLGSFTTFSTFSLDVVTLWERGETYSALGYVILSVVLSILSLFIGMAIMRQVFA